MNINEYNEQKKAILDTIEILYKENKIFDVIKLLENSNLDDSLCLELVRAYINAAAKASDPYSLYEKALLILSKISTSCYNEPKWHFYEGYILYKKELFEDALIRFEKALKLVDISDSDLFYKINTLLENTKNTVALKEHMPLDNKHKEELLEKISAYFGTPTRLCSFDNIELYHIAANEKHDYNIIISVGMSNIEQKTDNICEFYEVILPLPKEYRFNPAHIGNFEIFMMIEVLKYLAVRKEYVGFGYYLEKENGFSDHTSFNAVMLSALGDYNDEYQQLKLTDRIVKLYQLIPLKPFELNYRKHHTAEELLNVFKENRIMLTPFIATRDDVLGKVRITEK